MYGEKTSDSFLMNNSTKNQRYLIFVDIEKPVYLANKIWQFFPGGVGVTY